MSTAAPSPPSSQFVEGPNWRIHYTVRNVSAQPVVLLDRLLMEISTANYYPDHQYAAPVDGCSSQLDSGSNRTGRRPNHT